MWKSASWLALAAGSLLSIGCDKAPIFESVATAGTGKNAATSLSIPVPANGLSSPTGAF